MRVIPQAKLDRAVAVSQDRGRHKCRWHGLRLVLALVIAATAACTSEGPLGPPEIVAADAAAWGSGRNCGDDGPPWHGDITHRPATWVQASRIRAQSDKPGTIPITLEVDDVWREDIPLEGAALYSHRSQVDASQAVLRSGAMLLVGIVDYTDPKPYATELIGIDRAGGIGFVGPCFKSRTKLFAAFAEREGATSGVDLLRSIITNPDGPAARQLGA